MSRMTRPAALFTLLAFAAAAFAEDPPAGKAKEEEKPKDAAAQVAAEADALIAKMNDAKFAATRLDGATGALSVQDAKLLPVLVKLLKDSDADVRLAAVKALGARTADDQKKKAAEALGARIKFIEKDVKDQMELIAVAKSLHDLAQPCTIDALLDGIQDDSDLDVAEARAMAVANVPCAEAIEKLIDHMSRRGRNGSGMQSLYRKALQYATGERGVVDPDMWRKWWKDNKATFDFDLAAVNRDKARGAKEDRDQRKRDREGKKKD
ncbi:MAG: hypothetical protein HMLKMBBP_00195 [Planctomycetes bacterium]|nr:hypothetical protein [Planctomycetota bacterium]